MKTTKKFSYLKIENLKQNAKFSFLILQNTIKENKIPKNVTQLIYYLLIT